MPAYVSGTEATFNATADWSIAVPSGTLVGDLLICWAGESTGTGTFSAPGGWTVGQTIEAGADCTLAWAWKVATSTETSGSIAFAWSGTKIGSEVLVRYTGAHTVTPMNIAPTLLTQASGTTYTSSSITPTQPGCLLVAAATNDGNTAHTNPQYSSWTFGGSSGSERHDFRDATTFETMGVADLLQGTPASASASVTRANADIGVMAILAIAPYQPAYVNPMPPLIAQ